MTLDGCVTLVTGGAIRVGRAIVQALAAEGATLAVHHHGSAEAAQALVSDLRRHGHRAEAFRADLTDDAQLAALVAQVERTLGPIRVLVNSAARFTRAPFLDTDAGHAGRRMAAQRPSPVPAHPRGGPRDGGAGRRRGGERARHRRRARTLALLCRVLHDQGRAAHADRGARARARAARPGERGGARDGASSRVARSPTSASSSGHAFPWSASDVRRTSPRPSDSWSPGPDFITGQVIAVDGGRVRGTR